MHVRKKQYSRKDVKNIEEAVSMTARIENPSSHLLQTGKKVRKLFKKTDWYTC
jgi:hypothetical protein